MTQEEILEYNKLCAEFLNLHRDDEVVMFNMKVYSYDNLKFHSDWNWIMEVKRHIVGMGYYWFQYPTIIQINENGTISSPKIVKFEFNKLEEKEAVVQAIYSFLKFYNENLEMSN